MKKDYYALLGVAKGASEAEVKKAYKKLAMQWHPDRHQGDKKAEAKFKEINEAYQVIGDKEKRKQYDTFGTADFGNMGGQTHQGGGNYEYADIGNMFRNMGGRGGSQSFEFDLGDIFNQFGGGRASSRRQTVDDFSDVESLDMEQVVELSIWDLLLGTKISVDSPYSGKFKVTVPECTKPGTRLKVTGKGRSTNRKTGDLYLKIDVKMPTKLTSAQREGLEKMRTKS